MAIPAQGCVITWRDYVGGGPAQAVQEVQAIDVRPEIERIESRGRSYFLRGGEISLVGFSNSTLPTSKLLNWGTLKITVPSGGGHLVLHEGYAQYLSASIRGSVNEAILFAFQFRLWGMFASTGTIQ
jgi:hypothetical protein